MNVSRLKMSSVLDQHYTDKLIGVNITTRKVSDVNKKNMALQGGGHLSEKVTSIMVDSILSRDEELDVIIMLDRADELDEGVTLFPSFFTSTQMGKREPKHSTTSPRLSPVPFPVETDKKERAKDFHRLSADINDRILRHLAGKNTAYKSLIEEEAIAKKYIDIRGEERAEQGRASPVRPADNVASPGFAQDVGKADTVHDGVIDTVRDGTIDLIQFSGSDPLTQVLHDVKTITEATEAVVPDDGDNSKGDGPNSEAGSLDLDHEGAASEGAASDSESEGFEEDKAAKYLDQASAAGRLAQIDNLLLHLHAGSSKLADTVKSLETSLEFSYKEIADLKKENESLKVKLGNLETEDKRTQFQIKDVTGKLDKLDSFTKKWNLIFEGIQERDGKNEDTEKEISNLFDQLRLAKGFEIEACYRVGPYNKSRPRPILVSFNRQTDRDMVYSRRMDLKRTEDYQKVWMNEDVTPASRRKREIIRLISKEAKEHGIDCKYGKYALRINNVKYDENNLDELPPTLHPINLKQVQIDRDTVAYQSEHASFSNFFSCPILIGKHRFFCAEQAFQFLKAKSLNKPLASTQIYLSRDVRFIKQIGNDLGMSDEWEARKYDYMYLCLKRKFQQNPALKTLLLNTGNVELVEATPDRLWGCGATLSPGILKKHEWTGQNKQCLLTYVHDKHAASSESLDMMNISNEHIEAQWIHIHRPECKDVVICNVYRPPTGELVKAINYLDDCLKSVNCSKSDIFIMGDMNVDYLNKKSPCFKKLDFFVRSNGLTQCISTTTRVTEKQSPLLTWSLLTPNL